MNGPTLANHATGRVSPLGRSAVAALCAGTLAAGIAAVPAALRVPFSPMVWLALTGAAALVLGPALAGLTRTKPITAALFAVLTGLGLSAVPLALLAMRLKVVTHHRPLGAVTFAVIATVVVLVAALVALRLVTWTSSAAGPGARARSVVRIGLLLFALAGPALLLGSVFSAPSSRAPALDVVLAFGCAAVLGLSRWPAQLVRVAGRVGLPVWVALVVAGLIAGLSAAGESAQIASPALFAPFGWFVH